LALKELVDAVINEIDIIREEIKEVFDKEIKG